jgi:hypothetical protein
MLLIAALTLIHKIPASLLALHSLVTDRGKLAVHNRNHPDYARRHILAS